MDLVLGLRGSHGVLAVGITGDRTINVGIGERWPLASVGNFWQEKLIGFCGAGLEHFNVFLLLGSIVTWGCDRAGNVVPFFLFSENNSEYEENCK